MRVFQKALFSILSYPLRSIQSTRFFVPRFRRVKPGLRRIRAPDVVENYQQKKMAARRVINANASLTSMQVSFRMYFSLVFDRSILFVLN